MLILSDYNYPANIHLYRFQDLNIVLDVNSGAIHVLDELAAEFLHAFMHVNGDFYRALEACSARYEMDEVMEAALEIVGLWEDEALFTEPDQLTLDMADAPVKALCLNIAHACNMNCTYCFASQGDFGMKPALMSREVGRKALDFLVEQSQGIKNLEVDFFGGEPLLNLDVVRDIVAYGRQLEEKTGKKINFTLTTNTILLDESSRDFLVQNGIGVILSLDGRPEVNDRHRQLKNGQGSYATIVPQIHKMVLEEPVSYYVRGTYTRDNLDFSNDVRHLVELGFDALSLEPAVGPGTDYAVREEDLPQVLQEYEKLAVMLWDYHQQGRKVHFFHYDLDLQRGPCLAKRHTGCGAGTHYLAVTPEGDLYPCHQFVGQEDYCLGNVNEGNLTESVRSLFAANNLMAKVECRQCWARYFCGGGCHANNYFTNGKIDQPAPIACTMHKKRVEAAIYLDLKKRIQEG